MKLPPLALYVHIPWCVKKCPYCDFNSHARGNQLPQSEYVDCLLQDLQQELPLVQGRKVHSIFFGGGTPSLFDAASLERLLESLEHQLGFEDGIEITLEANPGTAEQEKFKGFRQAGINRLSIGVQSFDDRHLQTLGRIHCADEAERAFDMARRAGFDNINLDLMHGLPQQSEDDAVSDLNRALACGPEHLSWYQLTVEPNTEFYSRPPLLPEDDTLADIQQAGEQLLAQHGYQQYEVSAYARDQRRSRHNLNYWRFGDYLGLGAGAHGKITLPDEGRVQRRWKTRQPEHYMDPERAFCAGEKTIGVDDLPLEFMMNALRLCDGVPRSLFAERTGLSDSTLAAPLRRLQSLELMEDRCDYYQVSELGRRYLNSVIAEFMEDS